MNHSSMIDRRAIAGCMILCALWSSGCGPEVDELGQAALIGSPAVLMLCYPLPLLYQYIMRRAVKPDGVTLVVNTVMLTILGALMWWALGKLPDHDMDLVLMVSGFAASSMLTYVHLGWLFACVKNERRRVSSVILTIFIIMYVAPALFTSLDLGIIEDGSLEFMLFALWLFPGIYGLPALGLLVISLVIAFRHRKRTSRLDSAHTAQVARILE